MTLPFSPYFSLQSLRKTIQSFCTQCSKAKSKTASSTKHINPSSHWKTRWKGIFFCMFNHQRDHRSLLVRSLTVGFPLDFPLLKLGDVYPPLLSFIEPMYLSSFWGLSAALIPATALHVPGTQPVIESSVCYFFIFSVLFLTVIRDALKQLFAAVKKTKMVIWSCHYFTQGLLCRDTQVRKRSSTHARCDCERNEPLSSGHVIGPMSPGNSGLTYYVPWDSPVHQQELLLPDACSEALTL